MALNEAQRAAQKRYNKTDKAKARRKKYYLANREKECARSAKDNKRRYDALSPEQKKARNWRNAKLPTPTRPMPEWCEGCGRTPETTLCLDHDHVTGNFRGWLCHPCNRALGLLGDDIESVEKTLAYLTRSPRWL